MVLDDVTATTLMSLDDNVIATALRILEADIVEEIRNRQENDDSNDEVLDKEIFDPVVEKPSRSEFESALNVLKILPCLATKVGR